MTKLLEALGAPAEAAEIVRKDHFVGSVDEVVPKVQAFADAGARHIVIMALDMTASMETLERFMREVVPAVSAGD